MAKQKPKAPTLSPSGAISKHEMLARWKALPDRKRMKPRPIPYGHRGSTIDEDGIRLCGSLEFIESVLSHLKPLMDFEGADTRLGLSCSELTDKESGRRMSGRFRCAIQVHARAGGGAAFDYEIHDEDSATPAGLATRPRKDR